MTIKINREETNLEVLARIAKATARKYDCSLSIDFQNGKRQIEFIGDNECKAKIANAVEDCFRASADEGAEETPSKADRP
jgi:hypothetical protein